MVEATDLCESNYAIVPFVAEFTNAITGFVYIFVGLWTLLQFHKYNGSYSTYLRLTLCAIVICLLGIATILYHTFLTYPLQIFDELTIIIWEILVLSSLLQSYESNRIWIKFLPTLILCIEIGSYVYTALSQQWTILFHILHTLVILIICVILFQKLKHFSCYIGLKIYCVGLLLYIIAAVFWNLEKTFFCKMNIFGYVSIHALCWHLLSAISMLLVHLTVAFVVTLENNENTLQLRCCSKKTITLVSQQNYKSNITVSKHEIINIDAMDVYWKYKLYILLIVNVTVFVITEVYALIYPHSFYQYVGSNYYKNNVNVYYLKKQIGKYFHIHVICGILSFVIVLHQKYCIRKMLIAKQKQKIDIHSMKKWGKSHRVIGRVGVLTFAVISVSGIYVGLNNFFFPDNIFVAVIGLWMVVFLIALYATAKLGYWNMHRFVASSLIYVALIPQIATNTVALWLATHICGVEIGLIVQGVFTMLVTIGMQVVVFYKCKCQTLKHLEQNHEPEQGVDNKNAVQVELKNVGGIYRTYHF